MTDEQEQARKKLRYMEVEYWRLRNEKQRYMRCPYCSLLDAKLKRRNYPGKAFCCWTFAEAFKAILDRQEEIDKAANAARRACAMINTANAIDQGRHGAN